VTDKTGDCYQYDCVEVEAVPRLLLGHLSVVYDILWSEDQQHIITCDRDDKIRVTNYPATFRGAFTVELFSQKLTALAQ